MGKDRFLADQSGHAAATEAGGYPLSEGNPVLPFMQTQPKDDVNAKLASKIQAGPRSPASILREHYGSEAALTAVERTTFSRRFSPGTTSKA